MDQETIRLIVVALGAVIASLSAQLIAGAFSSQNTAATIAATREAAEAQREADRDTEHDRWLRDRKVVAYANFMSQLKEIDLLIQDTHKFPEMANDEKLSELLAKLTSDELMLLIPKKVESGIMDIIFAVRAMIAVTLQHPAGEERLAAYEAAAQNFATQYNALRTCIRKDLGAED
ncbi:hypothetical protein AB0P28_05950 [Pseudarthrobacter sp. NPDC089323]